MHAVTIICKDQIPAKQAKVKKVFQEERRRQKIKKKIVNYEEM